MLLSNFVGDERIFIDANIFIYNALDDPMYADSSSDFLRKVENNKIKAVITPHLIDFERVESITLYKPERSKVGLNNSNR